MSTFRKLDPRTGTIPFADAWPATTPKRIQRRRTKGWRMPEGAVYVGRPSRWGNPYRVGETYLWLGGDRLAYPLATARQPGEYEFGLRAELLTEAAKAVEWFRAWYASSMADRPYFGVGALRGHDLACWCPLCSKHAAGRPFGEPCTDCQPCHADVLLELANR